MGWQDIQSARAAYVFQAYNDVLQVTYDDGARWDDYATIKCGADANFAWSRAHYTRGQKPDRFRIRRDGVTIVGD